MNVFKIHQGYRTIGVNYGLPVFYLDMGPGLKLDSIQVIEKLGQEGLNIGKWVVLRGNALREQGISSLIEGLKTCKVHVEVEDDGMSKCPAFFTSVDRWTIWYRQAGLFNYGALRPNRDLLVYEGPDAVDFLHRTREFSALKGIVVEDPGSIFNLIKDSAVRVYKK